MESALGIPIDKEALFLAGGPVENDETTGLLGHESFPGFGGFQVPGQPGPLAEVTHSIEIGNAGSEVFHGLAFGIADNDVAVFLVEVGKVEEIEQAPEQVEVLGFFIRRYPVVAKSLQDEADAVHLPVGPAPAAEGPSQTILPHQIGQQAQILFRKGPQTGQYVLAQLDIGVQLKRLPDENQAEHPVNIVYPIAGRAVVVEIARAFLLGPS